MSAHTPGPWRVHKFNDTKSWSVYAENGVRSLGSIREEANARLIAAAPEMLEAARAQEGLIGHAQAILMAYLVPDGMSADEAINQLLGLFDGPDQRRIKAMYDTANAKAEGRS